jgi:Xaa-Pro dipeptidase
MNDSRFSQRIAPERFDVIQNTITARMSERGLDAVLTDDPEDVAYLTGFFHHPCERPVAVWLERSGVVVLMVPELERENALRQSARAQIVSYPEYPGVVPPFSSLAAVLDGAATAVGFSTTMSYSRLTAAHDAMPSLQLQPDDLIMEARYIKHPDEIVLHQEAARIADVMLAAGVALITDALAAEGQLPSEAELASHVGKMGLETMYAEHADVVVVPFMAGGLVYTGANSAFPHGLPSGDRLKRGDTFMLSLGCAVGGRLVEGERTFILGDPSHDQRRYFEAVRRAQEVGAEALRPGVECRHVNEQCLDVIREAGLGEFLRHRQGHGIGLGMHEPPWLEDGDSTIVEAGMVLSNEPGIYIPGHAGYRISDSMLVTENGSRPLTVFPRGIDDCIIPV